MRLLMALQAAYALRRAALRTRRVGIRARTTVLRAAPDEWALPPGWAKALETETTSDRHQQLRAFVRAERAKHEVYPPPENTLAALRAVDLDDVEVVIVGQDPYHGPGQAHGLCFSVRDLSTCVFPPSLRNVLREASRATEDWPEHPDPARRGDLSRWASEGVLLLNSVLTVRRGDANSHAGQGWEEFTDAVVKAVAERERGVVFALWGNAAKRKVDDLGGQHRVVATSHPSPLSAAKGRDAFMGSDCFSRINFHLEELGRRPVDWRLFVEGEEEADADAAALLADVFGGGAADEPDEAAAAPACGWPRFDASLQALRDACAGEDAAPVARDEVERFAALVRILVAPRTPSAIVDAAVDALRPTTAADFASRAQDDVESMLRECQVAFPSQKAKYLVGAAEVCAGEFGGDVPRRPRDMRKLPGVGEKGAAQLCVSAWGCDDGGVVVGTSTHRACNALGWVETSTPTETKKALEAWLPRDLWRQLPSLVAAHVAAPAPAVSDPLLGRGVAVFLPPGHKDRDAVVAACAALGGGGAREYRIHRSKFDADAPEELLASAKVDSYGVVEAVVEDLRARRISCYARRVVDGDGEVPF